MKLPVVSSSHLISELKKRGFTEARYQGKGSHTALISTCDTDQKLLIIVPKRDIIPVYYLRESIGE